MCFLWWSVPSHLISMSIDAIWAKTIGKLTHWGQVMHICIIKPNQHWFRWWLITWPVPSHYLNPPIFGGGKYGPMPILHQVVSLDMNQCIAVDRADSRFTPSHWETLLQSNAVSYCLAANLESAVCQCPFDGSPIMVCDMLTIMSCGYQYCP